MGAADYANRRPSTHEKTRRGDMRQRNKLHAFKPRLKRPRVIS
jgi:hypothetical protein